MLERTFSKDEYYYFSMMWIPLEKQQFLEVPAMMKTGCSEHGVIHGESFSLLRIFNQSRQNRANQRWGVCFGGWGSPLAPFCCSFVWDGTSNNPSTLHISRQKCLHYLAMNWGVLAKPPNCPFPPQTQQETSLHPWFLLSTLQGLGAPGATGLSQKKLSGANQTLPFWHPHSFTAHRKLIHSIPAPLISQWIHVVQKSSKCKMLLSTWQDPTRSWLPLTPQWVQPWGEGQEVTFPTQMYLSDLPISHLFLQPEGKQQPMPNAA